MHILTKHPSSLEGRIQLIDLIIKLRSSVTQEDPKVRLWVEGEGILALVEERFQPSWELPTRKLLTELKTYLSHPWFQVGVCERSIIKYFPRITLADLINSNFNSIQIVPMVDFFEQNYHAKNQTSGISTVSIIISSNLLTDYANFQRAMDVILSWQWDYRLKIYINEADIINLIDLNDINDQKFIQLCFNTLDQKNPLDNDAGLSLVNYGSIAGYQEQFGKSYLEEFEITKINNKWNLVELDEGNLEIFVVKSAQGLNWYQDNQESLYHKDQVKLIDKIDVSGSDLLLEY